MADQADELIVETVRLTKIYQNRQIALNDVTLRVEPATCSGSSGRMARERRRWYDCSWACTGRQREFAGYSASR